MLNSLHQHLEAQFLVMQCHVMQYRVASEGTAVQCVLIDLLMAEVQLNFCHLI